MNIEYRTNESIMKKKIFCIKIHVFQENAYTLLNPYENRLLCKDKSTLETNQSITSFVKT